MPDQSYPVGIRNGLISGDHRRRMGISVWEFMWCVDHVTQEYTAPDGEIRGKVLGGSMIPAARMAEELGVSPDTIYTSLKRLDLAGYITAVRLAYGFRIEVRHSKKWVRSSFVPNPSGSSKSQVSTSGDTEPERLGDSEIPRFGETAESPIHPMSETPDPKDIAVREDIADSKASTIQGETPASRPPEWWLRVQERVATQLTPGALHEVQRCAISVNGNIVTVHPAADGRERVVRNLAVLLQAARRELGHSVDMMIGPNIEARAGPE